MPEPRAILRRTRCAARSKRSGERCRKWSAPGASVCHLHGARSPQAVAGAERREIIAELLAADPRPLRIVLRDAVTVSDVIMQDVRAEIDRTGSASPETIDRLALAAGRAAQLARVALDVGLTDDEGEIVAQAHGESLARALRIVLAPLMPRVAAGPADARAISEWLRRAVPLALRQEPVPEPPTTWRMSHAPELESGEMRRRRERTVEDALMAEASDAVAEGLAPREDDRPGRGRLGIAAPGAVTTSTPLSARVDRDVPLSLDDLRAGRGPNAWRDSGSPLTERIGP